MPVVHHRVSRMRVLAIALVMTLAFVAALAYGFSGSRVELAVGDHCLHHHPDHHASLPGGTGHHFNSHYNHEWWRGYGNLFDYYSGEHLC